MSLIPPSSPYASRKAVDAGVRGRHEDYLRIVRGRINTTTPTILQGIGFTIVKNTTGDVTITFVPAFSATPAVVTSAEGVVDAEIVEARLSAPASATAARIRVRVYQAFGTIDVAERIFSFIATGPI